MPKKKSAAPPPTLRTGDFIRFTTQASYAFERISEIDPSASALLGDVGALQRTGKLILGALRSGGLVVFPPAPPPDPEAPPPGIIGRAAKGKSL